MKFQTEIFQGTFSTIIIIRPCKFNVIRDLLDFVSYQFCNVPLIVGRGFAFWEDNLSVICGQLIKFTSSIALYYDIEKLHTRITHTRLIKLITRKCVSSANPNTVAT